MSKSRNIKDIITNKRAFFEYHIDEKIEAGLVLQGWEVKAIRAHRVQIQESYILIKNQECWLIGCHISPLPNTKSFGTQDPTRTRKCLLRKKEIEKLIGLQKRQGFTIVPLRMYLHDSLIKIEIASAKGKKNYDKREAEKRREWEREQGKILKNRDN
ncbi:MAG: SsrA-binding protein SmpB [Pseudomonadota bacterium]|nr:SsrA-binding protein SmpB [Pseudomonadota bacterium]